MKERKFSISFRDTVYSFDKRPQINEKYVLSVTILLMPRAEQCDENRKRGFRIFGLNVCVRVIIYIILSE